MKKILVLGSDYNSVEVVKNAKQMGLYVIVTDLMDVSPAKRLADEAWKISTNEIDVLEQLCIENNITAILFGASDFNVDNARTLCKRLNLPIYCDNDYVWNVANNKQLFKELCNKFEILTAKDYSSLFKSKKFSDERSSINYPVVVKPSNECGNVGVSFCDNYLELIEGYKFAQDINDNYVIVEEKIVGQEYNVHYAVANGVPELLYISAAYHEDTEKENVYSLKITDPAFFKEFDFETNSKIKKMITSIGCKEGLIWFDCIKSVKDGKFYFLEMGHRFGGVMTYAPFKKVSGFDTIKWMIDIAIGEKHSASDLDILINGNKKGIAVSYQLFSKKDGLIKNIYGLNEINKCKNIFIDIPKSKNCYVRGNTCIGLIGMYCSDISDIIEKLHFINETVRIETDKLEDTIIHFKNYDVLKK